MSSESTRRLIANSFLGLVEHTPMDKVTVSDIIERSGKNRKTFYYHFRDKSSLIKWIFRFELGTALKNEFGDNELVYQEGEEDSAYEGMPCYTRVKEGVRQLDGSGFARVLTEVLDQNRVFYAQAFADRSSSGLVAYMTALYAPAVREDIEFTLSNRFLPEDNLRFLTQFYTGAMVDYLVRRTCADDPSAFGVPGPFSNIVHDSMDQEISKQQRARSI